MGGREYYDNCIFLLKLGIVEMLFIGGLCLYNYYSVTTSADSSVTVSSMITPSHSNDYGEDSNNVVISEDYTEVSNFNKSMDTELGKIIQENILGDFKTESGAMFSFGRNNYYSGFFDSQNTSVYGYIYNLYNESGYFYISICNSKKTKMVVYQVQMNGDNQFILYYPQADLSLVIEREVK